MSRIYSQCHRGERGEESAQRLRQVGRVAAVAIYRPQAGSFAQRQAERSDGRRRQAWRPQAAAPQAPAARSAKNHL